MFLAETLADKVRLEYVKDRIRFDKMFTVKIVSRGGGLALLWKSDIEVEVVSSSVNHIDVTINKNSEAAWRFTGFYGEPETHMRHESWDLLKNLHRQSSMPWLCAGDFNEITKQSEKVGGRLRPFSQMQNFREALDECGLMDLGYIGSPFTWSKHYRSRASIWERLDRAVASHDWFIRFPGSRVHHVDNSTSDHKFLWIDPSFLDFQLKKKVFRFEDMWLADKGCGETVEGVWQASFEGFVSSKVIRKIERCGKELTLWSRNKFGNIRRELVKKRKELNRAEQQAVRTGLSFRVVLLKKEINSLMGKEERMWRQRSRFTYIKEGDRNTRFFHSRATMRKRRNCIKNI